MTASGPETVTAERPPEVAALLLAFKPAVSTAEVMALPHPVKAMAANASAGNKLRFIFASPLSAGNCIGLAVKR